jgi:hypothetical protein
VQKPRHVEGYKPKNNILISLPGTYSMEIINDVCKVLYARLLVIISLTEEKTPKS